MKHKGIIIIAVLWLAFIGIVFMCYNKFSVKPVATTVSSNDVVYYIHEDSDVDSVGGVTFKVPKGFHNITKDYFNATEHEPIDDVMVIGNYASIASPVIIQITTRDSLSSLTGKSNSIYEQIYNNGSKVADIVDKGSIKIAGSDFDAYEINDNSFKYLTYFNTAEDNYTMIVISTDSYDYDSCTSVIKEL